MEEIVYIDGGTRLFLTKIFIYYIQHDDLI